MSANVQEDRQALVIGITDGLQHSLCVFFPDEL